MHRLFIEFILGFERKLVDQGIEFEPGRIRWPSYNVTYY